ncbi:MAG: alpha/beta hydrolase [Thermomicrobiales bacterium]
MILELWPAGHAELADPADEFVPTLTHYPAAHGELAGAVIVAPGGGYRMRAEHEGEPIARWLNSIGIHAFVLDYRVAPHRHPNPLRDAQRAIRIVRSRAEEWKVRPDRIGILGFSAGGHLAATAGTIYDDGDTTSDDPIERVSCRPDAMVLCYAVINLADFPHQGSLLNLLGDNSSMKLRAELSPDLQVTSDTPPTFLWHTADDAAVDVSNSLRLAEALSAHGVAFALHVYPHGRHGLGMASELPDVSTWTQLADGFLTDLGFKIQA